MGKFDKAASAVNQFGQTLASMVKIALLSRRSTVRSIAGPGDEIVVLGNGPSLNQTVAESMAFLRPRRKMAVNFAACTPLFFDLRPEFYVLADPHFFLSDNENVAKLWRALKHDVDWHITLFVPANADKKRIRSLSDNPCIEVRFYNLTPVEGYQWFRNCAYRHGWGMPRPRNVLIPSIMLAVNSGFKTIYVAGADHSWMRTISVDDNNRVVSIQPHFYKDSEKETTRVNTEYMNYPLHQIVYSFYVAFKSYFDIRSYAQSSETEIWNITPGSFIDAFPRKKV